MQISSTSAVFLETQMRDTGVWEPHGGGEASPLSDVEVSYLCIPLDLLRDTP